MPIGNNVSLLIIVYCLISQLERFVSRILKILYRQPNSSPQSHQFTSSIVCKCCTSVEKQQYRIAVNKVIVRVFIYIKARGMPSGKRERGGVCIVTTYRYNAIIITLNQKQTRVSVAKSRQSIPHYPATVKE